MRPLTDDELVSELLAPLRNVAPAERRRRRRRRTVAFPAAIMLATGGAVVAFALGDGSGTRTRPPAASSPPRVTLSRSPDTRQAQLARLAGTPVVAVPGATGRTCIVVGERVVGCEGAERQREVSTVHVAGARRGMVVYGFVRGRAISVTVVGIRGTRTSAVVRRAWAVAGTGAPVRVLVELASGRVVRIR